MQITVVQSEIEEALRRYIGSQLTVAQGMQMNIDLRAGRGTDGFTATIDIRPGKVETTIAQAPKAAAFQAAPEEKVSQEEETQTGIEGEIAAENAADNVVDNAESPFDTEAKNEEASETKPEDEQFASPPSGAKRSLFKGLGKPKNH